MARQTVTLTLLKTFLIVSFQLLLRKKAQVWWIVQKELLTAIVGGRRGVG